MLNHNAFKTYHPLVNFLYFGLVISFTMFIIHPIALMISLGSSLILALHLKGLEKLKKQFIFMIPLILFTSLLNPLFNHQGVTILTYFKSGNPLTLESIVYGFASAMMLMSMMLWFVSFNEIISSDKFVYLFGKIMPSLALMLSMALRFVPEFTRKIKEVANTQKTLGKSVNSGSIFKRIQNALLILSIVVSWALEDGIDTADSMKSRGYGLENRTSFSIYTLNKKDKKVLLSMSLISIVIILFNRELSFTYFPMLSPLTLNTKSYIWTLYLILCLHPLLINFKEARHWKLSQSKI